jgi:hypothetical protein
MFVSDGNAARFPFRNAPVPIGENFPVTHSHGRIDRKMLFRHEHSLVSIQRQLLGLILPPQQQDKCRKERREQKKFV